MSATLSAVAVLQVSAVLQDCVDQLDVVGNLISKTHRDLSAAVTVVSEDVSMRQRQQKIAASRGQAMPMSEAIQEHDTALRSLTASQIDHLMSEDMVKVQCDGRYASQMITEIMEELNEEGTFNGLINILEEGKRTKAQLIDITTSDKQDRLRIKTLKKHLDNIRKETEQQIQERDKMAAHLEDRLQELKIRRSAHQRHVKDSTDLLVYQGQKWNSHMEKQLEDEIQMLKKKLMEEEKIHKELKSFLEHSYTRLEENLDYWMERYEQDMEDKLRKLNSVKTTKATDWEKLMNLSKKYRDCEQVISEDRLEKENLRKQLEKEQLQRKAAIKIQSWWRGTLVRKGLGPFRKAKKPKQKKVGKKGKKKK